MPRARLFTLVVLVMFVVVHAIAIPVALINPGLFETSLAQEDGPLEYGTAIFLLVSALLLIWRGRQLQHLGRRFGAGLTWLYAALYAFVAGEEVSWGQRIFDWQSGSFFVEHNFQAETNLHNLVIGDTQLASTIFGNDLTPVLLAYLILLPILYPLAGWVRKFASALAVPVPSMLHAALAIVASVTMVVIGGVPRQFELYEFAFSLMSLMIFANPRNPDLYGEVSRRGTREESAMGQFNPAE
ncbi:hypothetical protein DL237_16140 [Pseudooceanicola sediminis]|uniref:Uncharacterized protein n=1 Tax=Pseudooceanicola sediminis TaxID=2211117 RepID=A0A399IXB3_9RHOB|nr:hypothetical protein [Pseudooceanicola sediminis]KAA2312938.1 hypothetical protein E0K93_15725 [Puniceibacterium sp. HSS470]RII37661.1 hypothetical protein DL237_16140 [Pseudooceanicola sediminis]|tara:strand:- start:5126 stop:5851 length:726 start_codon:yes stop_codon:yes gene_type:complete